jgi:protein-disulfide isomerase
MASATTEGRRTAIEVCIVSRSKPAPQSRRERRAAARLERPDHPRAHRRSAATPAWRSPAVLVTAAALVAGAVLIFLALPNATEPDRELIVPPVAYPANLIRSDVIGSATAPVVIELYSDFQCPACKLFVTTQLHRLIDEFVTPGAVRIEAMDVAFLGSGQPDESLELAVGAACATEQDRYWQYHDVAFWNQGRENRGDHSPEFIGRVADAASLDRTKWDACVARSNVRGPITSRTQAATGKGIRSTPTLVVNGQPVVGVPNYDQLAAMIRSAAGASTSPGASASPAASTP